MYTLEKKLNQKGDGMKPGVYNITNDEYHSSPGISRSGILEFRRSPLHYWHKYLSQNKPQERQTAAQIFGNAIHAAVLEPDTFLDRFCIMPKVDRRTTKGKEEYSAFCAMNIGKNIITEDDYELIKAMLSSIIKTDIPRQLIEGAQYEQSIFWNDPDTGVLCKARPDILHANMVSDLKSTVDASFFCFQRDLYNYGYHIQAAMIREGINRVFNRDIINFIYIVIEKEAPYAIGVYQLDEFALEKGHHVFKTILAAYKNCLEMNEWPGYQVQRISLPTYAV